MQSCKTFVRDNTLFISLPKELRRPIDGGCKCTYCISHPDKTPQWDTLAAATDKTNDWTATVHYPEFAGQG